MILAVLALFKKLILAQVCTAQYPECFQGVNGNTPHIWKVLPQNVAPTVSSNQQTNG